MTVRLYQSRIYAPPQIAAEVITVDKWHSPLGEPRNGHAKSVAQRAMVAVLTGAFLTPISYPGTANTADAAPVAGPVFTKALVAQSFAYAPLVQAETVTIDKWYGPLNGPVRRVSHAVTLTGTGGFSAEVKRTDWYAPLEQPTRRKPFLETTVTSVYQPIVVAETVTVDKWYAPLQVQVPRRALQAQHQQAGVYVRSVEPGFWTNLNEPPKSRRSLHVAAQQTSAFTKLEVNESNSGWYAQLSEPTKRKPSLTTATQQTTAYGQLDVKPLHWHEALSEPLVKTKRPVAQQQQPNWPYFLENRRPDWLQPLSQPTRRKPFLETRLAFTYQVDAVVAEPGDADTAAGTWSAGPTFGKSLVAVSFAYAPFTPAPEVVTVDKWYGQLNSPVRRRSHSEVDSGTAGFSANGRSPDWYSQLPEPRGRRFATALQQQPAWPYQSIGAEVVTVDKWYAPLELPTRRAKPRDFTQAASTQFVANIFATWYQPLSVPNRRVVTRQAPLPTIYAFPIPPVAGDGTEYNWWTGLDLPTRRKGLETRLQSQPTYPPLLLTATLENGWYSPLGGTRRRAPVAAQQHFAYGQFDVKPLHWHEPLSEPTRRTVVRQGPLPSFYPLPLPTLTVTDYGLFAPLSEPVLRKVVRLAPLPSNDPFPRVTIGWYQVANAPPARRVFHTSQQQYLVRTTSNFPGPGIRLTWFDPLGEKVRLKIGMAAQQQQFYAFYPLPLPIDLSDLGACRYYIMPGRNNILIVPAREDYEMVSRDDTEVKRKEPTEVARRNNITDVECS